MADVVVGWSVLRACHPSRVARLPHTVVCPWLSGKPAVMRMCDILRFVTMVSHPLLRLLASSQYSGDVPEPQIYAACERSGRIAYKRSGGSRLITHNDHWKSQIRHALYTSDRFVR
jgi:hypothetical protein